MAEVLQMLGYLHTFLAPLLRNLIADAPHDDAWMITMMLHQVGDVLIAPFLEELGITILTFRINPHIEALSHYHHAEGITDFHLHSRRHVVGCTDGVATHLLHRLDLADECSLVLCSTQRTKVVVQADTLDLAGNAIELETIILGYRDGTDTGLQGLDISHLLSLISGQLHLIEIRRFRRPELRICYLQGSLDFWSSTLDGLLSYLSTFLIKQGDDCLARLTYLSIQKSIYLYFSFLSVGFQSTHESIPGREVFIAIQFNRYRTVKTATRIPSATLLYIIKMYLYQIILAKLDKRSDVDTESIVTICPLASFLSIYGDYRLAHGTIENQDGTLVTLWSRPVHLIHPLTYPRQRTRAA